MRRTIVKAVFVTLLALGILPALKAQDKGRVTGSVESNSIYYMDDSVIGSPEHPWGSNNYVKLDYANGGFTAGITTLILLPILEHYLPKPRASMNQHIDLRDMMTLNESAKRK